MRCRSRPDGIDRQAIPAEKTVRARRFFTHRGGENIMEKEFSRSMATGLARAADRVQ
jgi:hypothetical protein